MSPKLIVVKAGTASLTKSDGSLDVEVMRRLVDQIAEALNSIPKQMEKSVC